MPAVLSYFWGTLLLGTNMLENCISLGLFHELLYTLGERVKKNAYFWERNFWERTCSKIVLNPDRNHRFSYICEKG